MDKRNEEQNALLKVLARMYKKYPNLQLGQLIVGALPHCPNSNSSVENTGDTELLIWLLKTEKELSAFNVKSVV